MKNAVGAREANQQFSKLLKEVEKGREITITRNGTVVARLVPPHAGAEAKARKKAYDDMLALMDKGLDFGGRKFTRDEMHDD